MEGAPSYGTVFNPQSTFPEAPPEWKEKEAARIAEMIEKEGISIRRRPATGPQLHNCGTFQFKLQNEGNTPRNILEEIIWSKDAEVAAVSVFFSSCSMLFFLECGLVLRRAETRRSQRDTT